jgi:cell wall-associated NlpC family hydrolase
MTTAERAAVIAEALSWQGTPYHSNAAVKGAGADCALMPLATYKAALPRLPDLPLPRYVEQWHLHRGEELYLDYVLALGGTRIEYPEPGDFCLFKQGRLFSHGAIVLDAWPSIIHAVVISGVVRADATAEARLARAERMYFTL